MKIYFKKMIRKTRGKMKSNEALNNGLEKYSFSEDEINKKTKRKYTRNYNPNKMCGVNDDSPCFRSLFCPKHTLDEKRKVEGRKFSFDFLLEKEKKKKKKKGNFFSLKKKILFKVSVKKDDDNKLIRKVVDKCKKKHPLPLAIHPLTPPTENQNFLFQQIIVLMIREIVEKKKNPDFKNDVSHYP